MCFRRHPLECAAQSPLPYAETGVRLEVEGAVFVVDHAVVEAGGLDDPRPPARRDLFYPGPQRAPPLAHCSSYAVLFHGTLLPAWMKTRRLLARPCHIFRVAAAVLMNAPGRQFQHPI